MLLKLKKLIKNQKKTIRPILTRSNLLRKDLKDGDIPIGVD